MRIGIFTDTYPPFINGVSTSIAMLKKALEKKGHQVFVVTVNDDAIKYKYENDDTVIRIPGIPIGIYDYRLTGIYPLRAIGKIRAWNLDVIHSHTEFGVGTFARIIAKQLGIPLIHTYHTMYEDYVHYITKGYFDGASKKVVEYLTLFYCDKTLTELIVPSKKTYDLFKEKYKVDRTIHIIPTGIEIERFYKEKYEKNDKVSKLKNYLGISDDDFVILFVGRLGKEKSVDVLINEHRDLVKKNKRAKLLIIGDGPDAPIFKSMVQKYKLEDNVIFTGKVPWEEVPLYYQCATVFSTASNTETQGLTVIEAMAASKPVVCLNDESFNTVVIDGVSGYLFDNPKEYRKKMMSLMDDEEKVISMGKQGRVFAEPHSSKYFAERVLDVYKLVIKKEDNPNIFKSFFNRLRGK